MSDSPFFMNAQIIVIHDKGKVCLPIENPKSPSELVEYAVKNSQFIFGKIIGVGYEEIQKIGSNSYLTHLDLTEEYEKLGKSTKK